MPQELVLEPLKTQSYALPIIHNHRSEYHFVRGVNPITNLGGWRPLEIPEFDPVPGVMVVHDILEHFPGDEHEVHNEYQALGAMFWLRHEGGFFSEDPTSRAVVAPAFGMLFQHIVRKELSTKPCPLVKVAHRPLKKMSTELEIQRTLMNTRDYVMGHGIYDGVTELPMSIPELSSRAHKEHNQRVLISSIEHALGWMRIGYKRASLRFQELNKVKLVRLYENIVDKVDKFGTVISDDNKKDKLTISVNYKLHRAEVSLSTSLTT